MNESDVPHLAPSVAGSRHASPMSPGTAGDGGKESEKKEPPKMPQELLPHQRPEAAIREA